MKTCFKCSVSKPLSEFYRHPHMGDGHLNKCKICTRKDSSNNRDKNLEYYQEYDRKRGKNPKRRKQLREMSMKYQKEHPLRRAANIILGNAIRSGKIKKHECIVCGKEKVEAHHPDYYSPLSVVWLCRSHHMQCHRMRIYE